MADARQRIAAVGSVEGMIVWESGKAMQISYQPHSMQPVSFYGSQEQDIRAVLNDVQYLAEWLDVKFLAVS